MQLLVQSERERVRAHGLPDPPSHLPKRLSGEEPQTTHTVAQRDKGKGSSGRSLYAGDDSSSPEVVL